MTPAEERLAVIHNKRRLLNIQLSQLEAAAHDPSNTETDEAVAAEAWGVRQSLMLLARQEHSILRGRK